MKILDRLKQLSEQEGLQAKITTMKINPIDEEEPENISGRILVISIPEAREFRNIIIPERTGLREIQSTLFYKYKFLKGYEAVWSESLGIIEGQIQGDDSRYPPSYALRRLLRTFGKNDSLRSPQESAINFSSPIEGMEILIGPASPAHRLLSALKMGFPLLHQGPSNRATITIKHTNLKTHDQVREVLLKISNSILFQIDLKTSLALYLSPDRGLMRGFRKNTNASERPEFTKPTFEYDDKAMALYWYAKSAENMPLLRFLAFYQIIEFYFKTYTQVETQQKLRNILKNPLFDPSKESDLLKIISILRATSKNKPFGDERSQLKATLASCVEEESLLEFYSENTDRFDFFDSTKKVKGLAKQKVNFGANNADIKADTANRVYEIRCKIVHTSDEEDSELILPLSAEIVHLRHDIDLIEFLAKQVIIASSRPINLGSLMSQS